MELYLKFDGNLEDSSLSANHGTPTPPGSDTYDRFGAKDFALDTTTSDYYVSSDITPDIDPNTWTIFAMYKTPRKPVYNPCMFSVGSSGSFGHNISTLGYGEKPYSSHLYGSYSKNFSTFSHSPTATNIHNSKYFDERLADEYDPNHDIVDVVMFDTDQETTDYLQSY